MARRGHNEGSIYGLNREGRKARPGELAVKYVGFISLGYQNGKRIRKKVVRRTRKEVAQALRELIREQERGVDLSKRIPTTREYFEQWFERDYIPKRRNKPNSINTYRKIIYNHIIPALGHIRLNKLARRHMTDMLNDMSERDYALNTIKLVRRVLIQVLSRAERDELIIKNYGKDTELPNARHTSYVMRSLTIVQIQQIMEKLGNDRLLLPIRLGYTLGLRRGEICALRWADIDLDRKTITVNGSLVSVKGQGLVLTEPKTPHSRRKLGISDDLVTAFQLHKQQQDSERVVMGDEWESNDYVFVRATTGKPLYPETLYVRFKKAAKEAGMGHIRLHDLRHTFASLLRNQGYDVVQISRILGHAKVSTTLDIYTHLFDEDIAYVADTIDTLMNTNKTGGS
ncbi:MAG: tyrosine-type recombinase/integrase [Chloroflexota bacterium]